MANKNLFAAAMPKGRCGFESRPWRDSLRTVSRHFSSPRPTYLKSRRMPEGLKTSNLQVAGSNPACSSEQ